MKLQIDLISLLHRIEKNPNRRRALTPLLRRESIKREFGNRIIDEIEDRTLQGKDKRGASFKGRAGRYSKKYRESLKFKVFKGKQTKPNLKLTGSMLSSMYVERTTQTGVILSFNNQEDNDKAEGHVNGANHLPIRDFWGIEDERAGKILDSVLSDFNQENAFLLEIAPFDIPVQVGEQAIFL